MSDFQKQTLKRYGRNFLIVCGVVLLCYSGVKFELVRYAVLTILTLVVVGGCVWALIHSARWDWWLRGRLDKDEYEAYMACDRMFGWQDDEYLPTREQIVWIAEHNDASCETLWSMFEKLKGENQNGKQVP